MAVPIATTAKLCTRDVMLNNMIQATGDINRTVVTATAIVETMDMMTAAKDNSRFASAEAQATAGTYARKAERINRAADSAASRYAPRRRFQ